MPSKTPPLSGPRKGVRNPLPQTFFSQSTNCRSYHSSGRDGASNGIESFYSCRRNRSTRQFPPQFFNGAAGIDDVSLVSFKVVFTSEICNPPP